MQYPRSLFPRVMTVTLLLVGLVGCRAGDPRTETLTVGISKDSAVAVMGGGAPHEALPYLLDGHMIEALFFLPPGADEAEIAERPRRQTPLVVIDGTLQGWGWTYWDSVASAYRIPVPE